MHFWHVICNLHRGGLFYRVRFEPASTTAYMLLARNHSCNIGYYSHGWKNINLPERIIYLKTEGNRKVSVSVTGHSLLLPFQYFLLFMVAAAVVLKICLSENLFIKRKSLFRLFLLEICTKNSPGVGWSRSLLFTLVGTQSRTLSFHRHLWRSVIYNAV